MSRSDTVILLPRPYAKASGRLLLLPLLPHRKPLKSLPCEIWTEIVAFAFANIKDRDPGLSKWPWSFVKVCRSFQEIGLPLIYSSVQISDISTLSKFYDRLHAADQKWDSLRRIPYSTPGRWVQKLDLSEMAFEGQPQAVFLDSLLTQLFPLIPSMTSLSINPSFVLSRRALTSLTHREGSTNLRSISGLSYVPRSIPDLNEDPFVELLRHCPNLEVLVVIGQGLDPTELDFGFGSTTVDMFSTSSFTPLHLPKLHTLSLLSMCSSTLMFALIQSPLPGIKKLTITPYEDIPSSMSLQLITTHGPTLTSLLLFTPKSWPTRLHPSPDSLLSYCPVLNHLSLETPLPSLGLMANHNLRILSIPRPTNEFWRELERIFRFLPHLSVLRIRDVRWLRKGVSTMAQEAGVQGEMREWRRRLERRQILLVDADWRNHE